MKHTNRVLVTGGAGFLGSHLCQRLLEQGCEVVCLDNFYTGTKENIRSLCANPHFEVIRHDICHPISVEVDAIYHLACPASPVFYQRDSIQTTKINVLGALNVLDLAKRLKVPVLISSTSEVYGDPLVHPQSEDYWGHVNCNGPRACYDEGKRCAETLFMDYHRQHQVDIREEERLVVTAADTGPDTSETGMDGNGHGRNGHGRDGHGCDKAGGYRLHLR